MSVSRLFAQLKEIVFDLGQQFITLSPPPRATVQNTIPSTSGQQFDCSPITYEITV